MAHTNNAMTNVPPGTCQQAMVEAVSRWWREDLPITVVAMRASCEGLERLDPDELRLSSPSICTAAAVVGSASVGVADSVYDENEKDDAVIAGPQASVADVVVVIGSAEVDAMLSVVTRNVADSEDDKEVCNRLVGLADGNERVGVVGDIELEIRLRLVLYVDVEDEDISPLESALGAELLKGRRAIVVMRVR